jgi:hypothetical protein
MAAAAHAERVTVHEESMAGLPTGRLLNTPDAIAFAKLTYYRYISRQFQQYLEVSSC